MGDFFFLQPAKNYYILVNHLEESLNGAPQSREE
jgi:hypothetical protein